MRELTPREKELEEIMVDLLDNSEKLRRQINLIASDKSGMAAVYEQKIRQMQLRIVELEKQVSELEGYKVKYTRLQPDAEQNERLIERLKQDNEIYKEECSRYKEAFDKSIFDNEVISRLLKDEQERSVALAEKLRAYEEQE